MSQLSLRLSLNEKSFTNVEAKKDIDRDAIDHPTMMLHFDATHLTNIMANSGSDDEDLEDGLLLYTADEMMIYGLELARFNKGKISRAEKSTNVRRFRAMYGSDPIVCSSIFEDLQRTDIVDAKVPKKSLKLDKFLMAMHHLLHE